MSVQPLGGFNPGQAILGLGDAFQARREREQEEAAMQQQKEMQALLGKFAEGDKSVVPQIFQNNPQLGMLLEDRIYERAQANTAQKKQRVKDATQQVLTRYFALPKEERQAYLQQVNQDPALQMVAVDDELLSLPPEQQEFEAQAAAYGIFGEDFYNQFIEPTDSDLTANQKDFNEYLRLKKEDPEAARQFGEGAGFIKGDKKRLFRVLKNDDGTTTKYFSDGTEETVSPGEKVKTPDMKKAMSQEQATKVLDKAKEGQLKNGGFALTMRDGLDTIDNLYAKGFDPSTAAWVAKYLDGTTIGNLALDADEQTFLGSVEQMINAIARRETGAAITAFERKDFFRRYMPEPGDTEKRKKQKRDALDRQFKSIRGQSGSVYDALRISQGMDEPVIETEENIISWDDL